MATGITAGKPCTVNTFMVYCSGIGSQTQQTGNNTVVMPYAITTTSGTQTYYGFIGTKYTGYAGRCIVINVAGTLQRRVVISATAGTGSTYILTVNRDWDTNPISTDTASISYDMDDLETGGSNTGVILGTRTGTYDWSGVLNIGDGTQYAGLYMGAGEAADIYDSSSATPSVVVKSNGRLDLGYRNSSGAFVSGGIFLFTMNADGEPTIQFLSGAKGEFIDSLMWGQIKALFTDIQAGSSMIFRGTKFLSTTYGSTFFGATLYECSISGRSGSSEYIRFNASSVVDGLIVEKTAGVTGTNDTSTETITLRDIILVNNLAFLAINSNKTFIVINPTWTATTYSNFTWTTSTANYVYDKRSIDVVVQTAAGTKIQNANVLVYENTTLADLVLETYTDSLGIAAGVFTYKYHATNSSTTTYGGHALRVDCWTYYPFAAAQSSTSSFNGTIVLNPDPNIAQTNQATALSDGSTITWNKDTNASSIIQYTAGTGTLSVGDTVTQATSGATGIVTKIVQGDSAAGTVHLKTRNANAFASTYGLSATAWSATYTAASEQRFSIWIDGKTLTMQIIHDYLAALTSQTTLSATGELIHEWGKENQVRALYKGASGYYTERSGTLGVFITNYGVGTIQKFTDDSGGTWTPPTSVTLSIEVKDTSNNPIQNTQCAIYKVSDNTQLLNKDSGSDGIASEAYNYTTSIAIYWRTRRSSVATGTKYINQSGTGTITASGFATTVTLVVDPNA